MNTRKWINNCFASYFSLSLIGLSVPASKADSGFSTKTHFKSKYSRDINTLNYNSFSYKTVSFNPNLHLHSRATTFELPQSNSKFQQKAGKAVYKALSISHKKLVTQLAGAALIYSIDSIDMAEPLMRGFNFVKDKTRFNFGKCSQIRLSTKRLKAHSCFFDSNAKLEFHANYKMDSFRLRFNWSM